MSVDWIRRQTLFRTGYDKWVKIGQQVWKSWKLSLSENGWRIKSGTFLRDWIYSERIGLLYEYATLAESSSNLNPPTPSNFSRLMYPFHRIDTPFSINGESKKTWKMTKVNVLKNKDHKHCITRKTFVPSNKNGSPITCERIGIFINRLLNIWYQTIYKPPHPIYFCQNLHSSAFTPPWQYLC